MNGVYRLRVRYHQKGAGICACRCHHGVRIAHPSPCCGPGSREPTLRAPKAFCHEFIRETPQEAAEEMEKRIEDAGIV